jgi:hypothetical protein
VTPAACHRSPPTTRRGKGHSFEAFGCTFASRVGSFPVCGLLQELAKQLHKQIVFAPNAEHNMIIEEIEVKIIEEIEVKAPDGRLTCCGYLAYPPKCPRIESDPHNLKLKSLEVEGDVPWCVEFDDFS